MTWKNTLKIIAFRIIGISSLVPLFTLPWIPWKILYILLLIGIGIHLARPHLKTIFSMPDEEFKRWMQTMSGNPPSQTEETSPKEKDAKA